MYLKEDSPVHSGTRGLRQRFLSRAEKGHSRQGKEWTEKVSPKDYGAMKSSSNYSSGDARAREAG